MSQRRTRGNPNPRRNANVQPPIVSIPNEDTPQPAVDTPNTATTVAPTPASSNPTANLPIAPAIVTTPRSSNLAATPIEVAIKENFGRDRNLKTLLKNLQPKAFSGEGHNIPKILEEWIMTMDDYFALAEYNTVAQGIMARAKLEGSAKLWWKLYCQTQGKPEKSIGWEELKKSLKERYLPLNYSTVKMNEFLSCVRGGQAIDDYYEEFVKLSRHAPLMTEEQKLSRFIIGLEGHLAEEINALRPASLADALIRAKAKLLSLQAKDRKRSNPYQPLESFQPHKANPSPHPICNPELSNAKPFVENTQVNALPVNQSGRQIQCFECKEWGHKKANCPNKSAKKRTFRPSLPTQREVFLNRNKNQSA